MNYFIKIKNGKPFEYPIQEDNFVQAFPNIDLKFLPAEFAKVQMVEPPNTGWFHHLDEPTYILDNGTAKQVWTMSLKSESEIALLREQQTQGIMQWVEDAKIWAVEQKQQATNVDVIQAFDDYIAQLEAFTIVDPFEPNLPMAPRIGSDGQLLDVNASGSAPNVIG